MKKEDISFLKQAIKYLEESLPVLKESYEKKDEEKFNHTKKVILEVEEEIMEVLNG